ncbi:MAG: NADH-quinone oxidoreductase subunit J [Candidatus Omnitrophica bacterium]|nr:NADH-quinone oxidoreductase subunit J [Candidatus Omnitrophota bacterium]
MMTRSLLRSALGLALTSIVLTILMFRLNSPLAAVFELSVCSGLISVLFISTISLTEPMSRQETLKHMKARMTRFWYLPLVIAGAGAALSLIKIPLDFRFAPRETIHDVRQILWQVRQLDLIGQIIILLSGVFGVTILFREGRKK